MPPPCSRPPVSCVAGGAEAVWGRVRRRRRVRGRGGGAAALQAREALHLHARRQGKRRVILSSRSLLGSVRRLGSAYIMCRLFVPLSTSKGI